MAIVCHSRHLMAAPATFFDFWITSEAEFSVQSRLLIDGSSGGTTQSGLLESINSVGGMCTFGQELSDSCPFGQLMPFR